MTIETRPTQGGWRALFEHAAKLAFTGPQGSWMRRASEERGTLATHESLVALAMFAALMALTDEEELRT